MGEPALGAEVDAAVPRDAPGPERRGDRPRHRADELHERRRRRRLQHDVGERRRLLASLGDLAQREAQPLAHAEPRVRGRAGSPGSAPRRTRRARARCSRASGRVGRHVRDRETGPGRGRRHADPLRRRRLRDPGRLARAGRSAGWTTPAPAGRRGHRPPGARPLIAPPRSGSRTPGTGRRTATGLTSTRSTRASGRSRAEVPHELLDRLQVPLRSNLHAPVREVHRVSGQAPFVGAPLGEVPIADPLHAALPPGLPRRPAGRRGGGAPNGRPPHSSAPMAPARIRTISGMGGDGRGDWT